MELQVDVIQTVTDMPECLSMTELQHASSHDNHLQKLKHFIITGWPHSKDNISEELKPYWSYRDELPVINGIMLKGRCIIIPNSLRQQVLDQLHINHMGIEKTKLLVCKCVYWHSINADIEKYIKQCATCLTTTANFQSSGNCKDYWWHTSLMQYHLYLLNMVYCKN